ncbi:transposase [[Leptolyngbya] sp. PCC 7376]|uniref:transposase n=1 Tax=[Leptolyngbya] sp. PCC 7376 TaxID=111781 RepID=UPI000306BD2F|nr:transposase [[Leptolyngbya] sp. PCC 7376]
MAYVSKHYDHWYRSAESKCYPQKNYRYQERDESLRQAFRQQLHGLAPERLVYVDDSVFQYTLEYHYGYCHRSEYFYADKPAHRTERLSVIGAWHQKEVIAPMVTKGYINSAVFCQWFKAYLVPELLPGQMVILDNIKTNGWMHCWNASEKKQGKEINIRGFPVHKKVKLFRVMVSPRRTEFVVTNDYTYRVSLVLF